MSEHEYLLYLKAARNYKIARIFSLLFIIFTLGSLITTFFGFPCVINIFSSTIFFILGHLTKGNLLESGKELSLANAGLIFSLMLGLFVLCIYFILFILAKKRRWACMALIVLYSLDTLVVFIFEMSFSTFIFDILIHVVLIIFLAKGYANSKSLDEDFDDGVATTEADITEIYNMLKHQVSSDNKN